MAYQVVWSEEAQDEIHEIMTHLLDTWGDKVAEKFSQRVVEVSDILEKQVFVGQRDGRMSAVRQFPIKPYYMIEYTVIKRFTTVYILNVIDSRKAK